MIEFRNLGQSFLRKDLFSNVSLRLFSKERYGVVGGNGSGKSTLLKIITGEISPDSGEVVIPQEVSTFRIGQDHNLNDNESIINTAMKGQYNVFIALEKLKTMAEDIDIISLEELVHQNDGYRLKAKAQSVLAGLGIEPKLHEEPLKILSGGYKWRTFLAQCLIKNPDVLMLDEPTNHLDIVSIRWLELFLSNYSGTVILVSHDRKFMDEVCTQILDIDFGSIRQYVGNYQKFEKERALFLLQKEKEFLSQRKEIDKKLAFVERFRYKATKARQAQSRLKQIEKIVIEEPVVSSRVHPKFCFKIKDQGSKEVLEVKNLSKSYGDKIVINNFSFNVKRKERIAVIGPNGTGKSTLIKALALEFSEVRSKIKWGIGVTWSYFPQDAGKIIREKGDDISALDWLWQFCPHEPQGVVQGMLGRMLLSGEDAKKSVKHLSGGELSKLYLAKIMQENPNVLLLDEPTNHLDVESIDSLSLELEEYEGTIIMVSHDRDFLQKIATRLIEVEATGTRDFLGTYEDFVIFKERDYLDREKESKILKDSSTSLKEKPKPFFEENKKKKALLQKLKRDLEKTMLKVEELEKTISQIELEFTNADIYNEQGYEHLAKKQKEKETLERELENNLSTWESLEKDIENFS